MKAYGDRDCDGLESTFVRFARAVGWPDHCRVEVLPGAYVNREYE